MAGSSHGQGQPAFGENIRTAYLRIIFEGTARMYYLRMIFGHVHLEHLECPASESEAEPVPNGEQDASAKVQGGKWPPGVDRLPNIQPV
eukprot:5659445-Prymnesium_polylepis.1